jgi:hypothetical protein
MSQLYEKNILLNGMFFSFSSPDDFQRRTGVFGKFLFKNQLASSLVTILPDSEVEIMSSSCFKIELTFSRILQTCEKTSTLLKLVAASNLSAGADVELVGPCQTVKQLESESLCACAACISHFSTFALIYDMQSSNSHPDLPQISQNQTTIRSVPDVVTNSTTSIASIICQDFIFQYFSTMFVLGHLFLVP